MTAAQIWTLIGLALGLTGAIMNYLASPWFGMEDGHARLNLTDENARQARRFTRLGWLCIGGAVICGVVAALVQ